MKVTQVHIDDINRWLANTLPNASSHFLTDFADDWMLYGTGPAQLAYLSVMDAVAEKLLAAQARASAASSASSPGNVTAEQVAYRRSQVSGRKEVLPNVSNYSIQFNRDTVGISRTRDKNKPVRLVGGEFPTSHALNFFESFEESPFSLNNASYEKLAGGIKKDDANAPDKPSFRDYKVQDMLRHYAVRRACKFLMYESIGNGSTIRYVLDDLDIELAATRARKDDKVPVCTSELREIFRCWDYFQSRVTFYKDFYQAGTPWTNPVASAAAIQAWAGYADHRAQKALAGDLSKVPKSIAAKLAECRTRFQASDFAGAIGSYHESRPSTFGKFASFINVASQLSE